MHFFIQSFTLLISSSFVSCSSRHPSCTLSYEVSPLIGCDEGAVLLREPGGHPLLGDNVALLALHLLDLEKLLVDHRDFSIIAATLGGGQASAASLC